MEITIIVSRPEACEGGEPVVKIWSGASRMQAPRRAENPFLLILALLLTDGYYLSGHYYANITPYDNAIDYMSLIIIAPAAILLYLIATAWLGYRFISADTNTNGIKGTLLIICSAALILHAMVLYQMVFTEQGMNMGFYNALSLVSWVVALLVILTTLIKPVENLAMVILPMTALALFLEFILPSERIVSGSPNYGMDIHIILSISAYSLLTIAALQAVVLAFQEHQLRVRHPARVMRILPPMQTMEELLVQLLWAGFFLLSLGLATGLMFVHNILDQHLVHKTVLSVLAWLFFALVLFGRWKWGWRGKYLIRWTLGGFVLLMLAYFGSKLVLELILQKV